MADSSTQIDELTTGRLVGLLGLMLALGLSGCGQSDGGTETGDRAEVAAATEASAEAVSEDAMSAGPTGSSRIEGRILYEGEIPSLQPLRMDADPQCAAKHDQPVIPPVLVVGEQGGLANVLVKVVSGLPEGSYSAPDEPVVVDQRGCMYRPHVMAVVVGGELEILNSDNLLHNVHSLSKVNPPFNRAMPAVVKEAKYELSKPEKAFRIKCDVHPWMSAFVEVVEHPFFDVTGDDGVFSITGLPAGNYEIETWHEKLASQRATVMVGDDEVTVQDFSLRRRE